MRYEVKVVLDNSELAEVFQWLKKDTLAKEKYDKRKVHSLYLDDIFYSSVKDNLAGISDRKKIRLRWYGEDEEKFKPSFEIKFREGRLGFKEVHRIPSLDGNFIDRPINSIIRECNKELISQNIVLDNYLIPSLQTTYEREYYEDNEGVRFTLDKNINFYKPLLLGKLNTTLPTPYPLQVLEVKFPSDLKNKVNKLISSLNLRPRRHSKYLIGLSSLGLATYI